jgi:hypothetical protein
MLLEKVRELLHQDASAQRAGQKFVPARSLTLAPATG